MNIVKSMIIAFSMYSKIPMPRVEWDKDSMKYSLCFFPLVGVVIGVFFILWAWLSDLLGFNRILFAAVSSYIPIFITGGIHMDGFCDTIDGLSSNQSRKRKLEILSDPNSGAFAIIKTNGYFLLYFAVFTQLNKETVLFVPFSYVISRILSAYGVFCFKSAKTGGLLHEFKDNASRKISKVILISLLIIVAWIMIQINSSFAIISILLSFAVLCYYKYMAYKEFGGITGDLAGYFLQICELVIVFGLVIAQGVMNVWF